ncbi:MAG: hypothetical protein PHF29_09255 [Candidatus Riflebacteria bacterium]|nr:hypothetical protein [Candidatus Riflebacteria bacterium]
MRRWENVTIQTEIALTDEMRDELGLFDDAKSLLVRVKDIDDDGNKIFEGEVIFGTGNTEPMSVEQIAIYTENYGEKNNGTVENNE